MIGVGVSLKSLRSSVSASADPFAALIATLQAGAAQLIAHPLEYGSMYQDRAGTTPVTEPGQLVGLALDHGFTGSKPVLGPELVTSDDQFTLSQATISDLVIDANSVGTNTFASTNGFEPGKTYEVTFSYSKVSGGNLTFRFQELFRAIANVSGTFTETFVGVPESVFNGGLFFRSEASGWVGTIDNISVRELPGYHATAISDAARGVYREEGGIRYIEYNGVNTAYSTPALPAPLVDKAQVFAGVRKLSNASTSILAELSASAVNQGAFNLGVLGGANIGYLFNSTGTVTAGTTATGISAPITNVLSGVANISGDTATLRINGTQAAQSTADQGTGNYNPSGTYPLYYGARAGTSLFFNGRHYATLGPIVRFSAANATPEQIEAAEAYYTGRVV